MKRSFKFAFAMAAMAFAQQSVAQDNEAVELLVEQDLRLATIAERLLGANASLCRLQMPLTGMVLHSRDQYRAGLAQDAFVNGSVAVAAVVPGSFASQAGVVAGDGLIAVGSTRPNEMSASEGAPLRDAAISALADVAGRSQEPLILSRNGRETAIPLSAPEGCRALVEIRAAKSLAARSDGRVIQIDYALAEAATDEQLAVIFAHEMAHVVLEHRRRLEAAGVEKGLLGEFGKNQRLNRQVEVEADRMSVHLLANAGYEPALAPEFWRTSLGRRAGGGLLRSSTYPSPEARARLLEREIEDYLGSGTAPTYPGHLLTRRELPFD